MMQDYELTSHPNGWHEDAWKWDEAGQQSEAETLVRPSEQVLRNILGFARCYQTVAVGEMQVRFSLN